MEDSTPRPTLDVVNLSSSRNLRNKRRRRVKALLKTSVSHVATKIVSRFRRRQTRLLDGYESDPDPYDSDYIFYCLDTPRED